MNPIREAASRLPGHWHKGSLSDGNGNFCGLGHLDQVCLEEDIRPIDSARFWQLMDDVALEQYPDRVDEDELVEKPYFAQFNDHQDTTEDEAVMVMEKAAIKWDELNG